MKLTPDQVQHIADLAHLGITEEEKQKFAEQLSSVLEYMEILNEVDTTDVEPTYQVTGLQDVYRTDRVLSCDEAVRKEILKAMPERVGDVLRVSPVFE